MNKAATSKEELLETAREIAYREGIGKLSIRRLASESGVAIGTVYNYYPSKGDLITGVMEDFWRRVFHGSHFDVESDDFLASCRDIFLRLKENLSTFRQEFLDDILSSGQAEQGQGRETEAFYLEHMKAGLLKILERDKTVPERVWSETFTREQLVEFAFSNLVLLLREQKGDCDYLLEVLGRVLQKR